MAVTEKRLGATTVVANTDTTLYTVPGSTTTVVNLIQVCNTGALSRTFRIAWVDGAGIGSVATEDYLYYDATITANDSLALRLGLTMGAADTILVRASHAEVTFLAAGVERT